MSARSPHRRLVGFQQEHEEAISYLLSLVHPRRTECRCVARRRRLLLPLETLVPLRIWPARDRMPTRLERRPTRWTDRGIWRWGRLRSGGRAGTMPELSRSFWAGWQTLPLLERQHVKPLEDWERTGPVKAAREAMDWASTLLRHPRLDSRPSRRVNRHACPASRAENGCLTISLLSQLTRTSRRVRNRRQLRPPPSLPLRAIPDRPQYPPRTSRRTYLDDTKIESRATSSTDRPTLKIVIISDRAQAAVCRSQLPNAVPMRARFLSHSSGMAAIRPSAAP